MMGARRIYRSLRVGKCGEGAAMGTWSASALQCGYTVWLRFITVNCLGIGLASGLVSTQFPMT